MKNAGCPLPGLWSIPSSYSSWSLQHSLLLLLLLLLRVDDVVARASLVLETPRSPRRAKHCPERSRFVPRQYEWPGAVGQNCFVPSSPFHRPPSSPSRYSAGKRRAPADVLLSTHRNAPRNYVLRFAGRRQWRRYLSFWHHSNRRRCDNKRELARL